MLEPIRNIPVPIRTKILISQCEHEPATNFCAGYISGNDLREEDDSDNKGE